MDPARLLGAIVDTNSRGRFDLLIYRDGILAIKGTYVGVALRAAGVGMVGAGSGLSAAGAAGLGSAGGTLAGRSYEIRRLLRLASRPRDDLIRGDRRSSFLRRDDLSGLVLEKRLLEHSLIVISERDTDGRKYRWKPALNNFNEVCALLRDAFGSIVSVI